MTERRHERSLRIRARSKQVTAHPVALSHPNSHRYRRNVARRRFGIACIAAPRSGILRMPRFEHPGCDVKILLQLGANGMDPALPADRNVGRGLQRGRIIMQVVRIGLDWQSTCLKFMALTDRGMLSFAKPCVVDRCRRFSPICRLAWSGWKLLTVRTIGHACLQSLVTRCACLDISLWRRM
jgi:hypothetical protein